MSISESDKSYLLNIFQRIPPAHVALFLRLTRLYPTYVVDDSIKREKVILTIVKAPPSKIYFRSGKSK